MPPAAPPPRPGPLAATERARLFGTTPQLRFNNAGNRVPAEQLYGTQFVLDEIHSYAHDARANFGSLQRRLREARSNPTQPLSNEVRSSLQSQFNEAQFRLDYSRDFLTFSLQEVQKAKRVVSESNPRAHWAYWNVNGEGSSAIVKIEIENSTNLAGAHTEIEIPIAQIPEIAQLPRDERGTPQLDSAPNSRALILSALERSEQWMSVQDVALGNFESRLQRLAREQGFTLTPRRAQTSANPALPPPLPTPLPPALGTAPVPGAAPAQRSAPRLTPAQARALALSLGVGLAGGLAISEALSDDDGR